jgi:hypothetical protein
MLCRVAVVDGRGGHQPDPGVAVMVVVVLEESAAEVTCLLDVLESVGELGPVLQVLKCASL